MDDERALNTDGSRGVQHFPGRLTVPQEPRSIQRHPVAGEFRLMLAQPLLLEPALTGDARRVAPIGFRDGARKGIVVSERFPGKRPAPYRQALSFEAHKTPATR